MKIFLIVIAAILVLVIGALVVLGSVDIPAPSAEIHKTIPAERLPH
jgi:hypothetical protein